MDASKSLLNRGKCRTLEAHLDECRRIIERPAKHSVVEKGSNDSFSSVELSDVVKFGYGRSGKTRPLGSLPRADRFAPAHIVLGLSPL